MSKVDGIEEGVVRKERKEKREERRGEEGKLSPQSLKRKTGVFMRHLNLLKD